MNKQSTDDRDNELNKLERELTEEPKGTPYLEEPDEKNIADGSMCWLNVERMCGPECTAFNWELERHQRQGPNQCTVLYYAGQIGSAGFRLVQLNKKQRQVQEDKQRADAASQEVPKV